MNQSNIASDEIIKNIKLKYDATCKIDKDILLNNFDAYIELLNSRVKAIYIMEDDKKSSVLVPLNEYEYLRMRDSYLEDMEILEQIETRIERKDKVFISSEEMYEFFQEKRIKKLKG